MAGKPTNLPFASDVNIFEQKRWSKFTDSNTYAVDWEPWTLSNCIWYGLPVVDTVTWGIWWQLQQGSKCWYCQDEYSLRWVDFTIRGWWTRVNRHVSCVNTVAMLQISRGLARTCHWAGFEEDGQSHYQCIWCSSWCWKGSQILGSNAVWKMGHPQCFPYLWVTSLPWTLASFPCHGDGGTTTAERGCTVTPEIQLHCCNVCRRCVNVWHIHGSTF